MNVNDIVSAWPWRAFILPRFEGSHEKGEPDACWPWVKTVSNRGYGRFYIGRSGYVAAHRLAWAMANGPIRGGLHVCHRCDNPPCVNPAHLFLGTHQDNMRDMTVKGRRRNIVDPIRGVEHHRAALNPDAVRAIRLDGRSNVEIALDYGVTRSAIWKIKNGVWWRHVQ